MQNFIVLGIIPGTNVQTNFMFWLATAAVIASLPVLRKLLRKRYALRAYLTARKIARLIDRYPLSA